MNTLPPDRFAMLCFIVLMSQDSILDVAPSYMEEKMEMLTRGYDAFSYLDIHNMRRVIRYLNTWGITLPLPIEKEWKLQNDAVL